MAISATNIDVIKQSTKWRLLVASIIVMCTANSAAAQPLGGTRPCNTNLFAKGLTPTSCRPGNLVVAAQVRVRGFKRPTGVDNDKVRANAEVPRATRERLPGDDGDPAPPLDLNIPADVSNPFAFQVPAGLIDTTELFTPRDEPDEFESLFALGTPTSVTHVQQGYFVGDCSLLAVLMSICWRDPNYLPSLIKRRGTSAGHNAYSLKLNYFTQIAHVHIDDQLLQTEDRVWIGNWPQKTTKGQSIMWVDIFEKAVATLANQFPDATNSSSLELGYETISGTDPGDLMRIVTGGSPSYSDFLADISIDEIMEAAAPAGGLGIAAITTPDERYLPFLSGYDATTETVVSDHGTVIGVTTSQYNSTLLSANLTNGDSFLITPNHVYSILNTFPATQELLIRNPWNEGFTDDTPAQFRIPASLAQDLMSYIVYLETLPTLQSNIFSDREAFAPVLAPGPSTTDTDVLPGASGPTRQPVASVPGPRVTGLEPPASGPAVDVAPSPALAPSPVTEAAQRGVRLLPRHTIYGLLASGCMLITLYAAL